MDISKYKGLYLQETREHISGIEKGLLSLEKEPSDTSLIDNLFRHYHSIKGMSASMGYEPVQRLAHAQEDLLDKIRSKKLAATPLMASTLLECLDAIKELVDKVEADSALDTDTAPYLKKIKDLIEGASQAQAAPAPPPPAPAAAPAPELKLSSIMKVEGRVFDDLLTTVGDLFMALSSFKALSHDLKSIVFKDGVYMLGKTVNKLHDSILAARMLPIKDLTEGLPRVVRDISHRTGKTVELKVAGEGLSLDRAILEHLSDPLVHIIRNSVDHGIEPPGEREKAGKPRAGTITVSAYPGHDRVVIKVSDDGRGIDVRKIKEKAAAAGYPQERLRAMNDAAAMMLVCLPGVSAAEKVTDTSGRGVGMDIVKSVVEGLGGALSIESTPGAGTGITMELPRTTSIIKALVVKVEGEDFLLPISKVKKVIEVGREQVQDGSMELDGTAVPVVSLGRVLGMERAGGGKDVFTVIIAEAQAGFDTPVGGDGSRAKELVGLKVDDFGDEIDAYIKPLLPPMAKLWGASGITIMGDGRPVFLLDMYQIIEKAFHRQ